MVLTHKFVFHSNQNLRFGVNPKKQIAFLNNLISITSQTRILDIGCGEGIHLKLLSEKTCFAFGIDKKFQKPPQANIFCCNGFEEEFPKEITNIELAYVFSPFFGDDWNRLDLLAGKIARRLAPKGKFVFDLFHFASIPSGSAHWRIRKNSNSVDRSLCFRLKQNYFEIDLERQSFGQSRITKNKCWTVFSKKHLTQIFSEAGLTFHSDYSDFDIRKSGQWTPVSRPPFPRLLVVFEKA